MGTVLLPEPLPHQLPFLQSDATRKILCAGRKHGKSTVSLIPAVAGHGSRRQLRGAVNGARGTWYVPASYVADEAWELLKAATKEVWVEKHEVGRRIILQGGGGVTIRSCDNPEMQRGPNNDFVIVDEAALLKEKVWEQVIKPTMAATAGWAILISTPKGPNWFKREFDEAPMRPGWERWQRPSSDNPKVSREFLENEKRETSALTFAQEYLAEFVAPGGGLFKRTDARIYWRELDELVWAGGSVRDRDLAKFLTVDPATSTKTSADHSAIAAWGFSHEHDRIFLLDLFLARVEGPKLMRQIRAMSNHYDAFPFVEETSVSKHLLSFMSAEGIAYRTTVPGSIDKWTRAQPAAGRWERHEVLIPDRADWLPAFERQLYNFEPDGDEDDFVDCFSAAVQVIREEFRGGSGLPSTPYKPKPILPAGVAMQAPPGWK